MNPTLKCRFAPAIAIITLLVCRGAAGAEPARLPRELTEEGWIELFDGGTLFGWEAVGDASWRVENGVIRTNGEKAGFLMSTMEFADFELHAEFLAEPGTNSGIFLRTPLEPTDPARDCYELNIAPADNPFPTGSFVARKKVAPQDAAPDDDTPRWRTIHVRAEKGTFTVDLDGERVLVYEDPAPIAIGHIALQSNKGPISFRHVRLRPLGLKSIFNGRDLTGWNADHKMDATFSVTEAGELSVRGGRGQLESEEEFADFVLQLACKVNGEGLNSGVFFRSIPGEFVQGYESQISNTMKDGDPQRPADFGTGAIYRRQAARRIVAEDNAWFTKTLIARGPRISVWVNGYLVTDWVDTRPASENPREGMRLKGGTLSLQAHDPTTDLLFRDLRIVELPR